MQKRQHEKVVFLLLQATAKPGELTPAILSSDWLDYS